MKNKSTGELSLSNGRIYAYGLGEFGFNFFLVFISYYLMYFLTDVAMLPAGVAAVLYTLVQWFESLSLLASGWIMDRTRLRGGRYRPWMVFGSVLCAIGMVLFFTKYDLDPRVYAVVFPTLYLLAYWGYNFMWVSYRASMGIMAKTPQDTVAMTTAASQLGTVAMLLFSLAGMNLLYSFGRIETGFTVCAAIYGALLVISMLVVSGVVKPYDKPNGVVRSATAYRSVSLKDTLSCLKGPMIPFFLAFVFRTAVQMIVPALMVYHFQYTLKNPEGLQMYLLLYTLAQLVGLFFVRPVTAKLGKKNTFIVSSFSTVALLIAAYCVNDRLIPFLAIMTVNAFVTIFGASLLPAFITDIADYNEYSLGLKNRSFIVSVGATTITVASILGGGAASFGLAALGYDASVAVHAPEVIRGISRFMLFGGAFCALSSAVPMFFYKLGNKAMEEVYKKRDALAAQSAPARDEA